MEQRTETNQPLRLVATPGTTQITLPPSLQMYSPAVISKTFVNVRTIEDALQVNAPCLRALARQDGVNIRMVETLLKMHLVSLDAFLKQKNGLTVEEIELIAEEVMSNYGCALNFADIHVIFRNAKIGKYGELYNSLSCAKILKWFEEYFSDRCNRAYELNREADKLRYGNVVKSGNDALKALGYAFDEDGRLMTNKDGSAVVDHTKLAENNAKRKAEEERIAKAKQKQVNKDNDYLRWKLDYQKKHPKK